MEGSKPARQHLVSLDVANWAIDGRVPSGGTLHGLLPEPVGCSPRLPPPHPSTVDPRVRNRITETTTATVLDQRESQLSTTTPFGEWGLSPSIGPGTRVIMQG